MNIRRALRGLQDRATSVATVVVVTAGLTPAVVLGTAGPAGAASDPAHVTFTLEGCRGNAGLFPQQGPFVCDDSLYTTGNLGKGWNELDLVPHRLTTTLGSQTAATTTYTIAIVADKVRDGVTGYDFISVPVAQTPATCSITAGALTTTSGFGGADESLYRLVTITQPKGSTCVFDYYQRLALGSSEFTGSSLQSNLANQNLGSQGIGEKRVSIPDTPAPQTVEKDMTATQGTDHIWTITKSPTPAVLDFGNTCLITTPASLTVDFTITWTKGPADPSGPVTVVTHVYANNPAHRDVQVTLTDDIYAGTTPSGSPLNTATVTTVVPASTNDYLVLTHTVTLASGPTSFNDVATATYTDLVAGLPPITLTKTATAVAPVQNTGPELNGTATITDTESISGAGLTFSVAAPSVGSFTGGYTAGTQTTGPVGWSSGTQSGSGSVTFNKTVYLDQPRATSGALSDTATLTGSNGFTASANASVAISDSPLVSLDIDKTIPIVLGAGDPAQTFTFDVTGPGGYTASPTITFNTGHGGGSDVHTATLSGLMPGSYTVHERTLAPYAPQSDQVVPITLPTCSATATFTNTFGPAVAQARKVTVPAGSEAGWVLTLNGPGTPAGGESLTTTGTGYVVFTTALEEGAYTITETPRAGWDQTAASAECSFTVDYPADADRVFSCTLTNTQRGSITIVKDAVPDDAQDFAYTSTGGNGSFVLDDDADPALSNTITFTNLVPGTYTFTETLPVAGWDLTGMGCSSTNGSSSVNVTLATGLATVDLGPGDSVTCSYRNTKRAHVTVLKTENGAVPTHEYTFRLTGGPDSVSITRTTNSTNSGSLDFGLVRPGTYTLCELAVPAGTHSTLEDLGGTVNATTGDVCLTFTLAAGETRAFTIDNQAPGGGQRTIGYWKNWASCAGSNRVALSAKTGNHLMDEFLPQSLGNYVVDTCAKGVAVLKAASAKYAENQLAAQLLAAKLNIAAGASTCSSVNTAIAHADSILVSIGYTGPPSAKLGAASATRTDALNTARTLDRYNNGLIC